MRSPEETNDTVGPAGPHLDEGTVHAWLDGQLSPAEGAALEAHAASCAECAALVAEARGFVAGATRILGALDVDSGSRGAPSDASAAGPVVPTVVPIATQRRRRRWVMPSAIAATLVVGALTLLNQQEKSARDGRALVASAASESAPTADTAPSPVPAAAPSPLRVTSPEAGAPTTLPASGAAAGAATRPSESVAKAPAAAGPARADERARDFARPLAPSEQTVANAAPPPAPAPPTAQAPIDTVMAKAAERSAFAAARRDSAQSVAPLTADRQVAVRRREEAAPVQGRVGGVAADAAAAAPVAPPGALTITGRIVNESRTPVQGASVSVVGGDVGALTDAEGRYTIVVPATQRRADSVAVVARRIGYNRAMQTIASATGEATADFTMRSAAMQLEAVVVTGLDAQKRAASATAVPQCYAVSRPPAGVPAAFVLDVAAGRSTARTGARAGAGVEVGSWTASGGAVTVTFTGTGTGGPRAVTFAPPAVGGTVQAPLGSAETVAFRRVACAR